MRVLITGALGGVLLLAACTSAEVERSVTSHGVSTGIGLSQTYVSFPHLRIDNTTHVGGGVVDELPQIDAPIATRHGAARVRYGKVKNGIERFRLATYLGQEAPVSGGKVLRFRNIPPTIKVAHGTSPEQFGDVRTAVMLINDSLPRDWQMRLSYDTVPVPTRTSRDPEVGEIVITFAPLADWPVAGCERSTGCAEPWGYWDRGEIDKANIWVDHTVATARGQRLSAIIHEILHTLGRSHSDPYMFPDSIMKVPGNENSGFILYQLDRDALFAVYDKLEVGSPISSIYYDLWPWTDTSDVVFGHLPSPGGEVTFGAVSRNGLIQPWANGPTPSTRLENNTDFWSNSSTLGGRASWSGRLLGFTPHTEVVAAQADMSVELRTLNGQIAFTDMEKWPSDTAPGRMGTGTMYGDGDLHYPVKVVDDAFHNIPYLAGDSGEVSGAFFGPSHESTGGTLRRDDLIAGFAGRQPGAAAPFKPVPIPNSYESVRVSMRPETGNPTAAEMLSYLKTHASGGPWYAGPNRTWQHDPGLVRFNTGRHAMADCFPDSYCPSGEPRLPTVRLSERVTAEQRGMVIYAVAMVNRYLPNYQHIQIGHDAPALAAIENIPDGQIFVDFAPSEDWNDPHVAGKRGLLGQAQVDLKSSHSESLRASHVWIDWNSLNTDADRRFVVMHELLHALGLLGHVRNEDHIDSIMRDDRTGTTWLHSDHIPSIDGEAVRILYTLLEGVTEPEQLSFASLGAWEEQSLNLIGRISRARPARRVCLPTFARRQITLALDYLAFGIRHRNGVSVPWTDGYEPHGALVDNRELQGTVTWKGGLLGLTPSLRSVGGNAHISIDLGTMDGRAEFTELQSWPAGQAPASLGSGTQWHTGRLSYGVTVGGNYIRSTDGDVGTLHGRFYGPAHEGVAGSLERHDLTGAFGGTRAVSHQAGS